MNIPLAPNLADQSMSVTLDGVRYRLRVLWNASVRGWFMDLSLSDGTPLVTGKGLRCGADVLGEKVYDPRMPPGLLFVLALQDQSADPLLGAWGSTHVLKYNPAASGG